MAIIPQQLISRKKTKSQFITKKCAENCSFLEKKLKLDRSVISKKKIQYSVKSTSKFNLSISNKNVGSKGVLFRQVSL